MLQNTLLEKGSETEHKNKVIKADLCLHWMHNRERWGMKGRGICTAKKSAYKAGAEISDGQKKILGTRYENCQGSKMEALNYQKKVHSYKVYNTLDLQYYSYIIQSS